MSTNQDHCPLVLKNVTLRFGLHIALEKLNLAVSKNRVTVVIGPSGSGKSSILKCAAGLLVPDSGYVLFEGRRISKMGNEEYRLMQSRTGFHFQDAALWANNTIKENLSLPILSRDATVDENLLEERIAEALASVDLNLDSNLRPMDLSIGQRKLVSFLRATIAQPEILFLDDPDSLLDRRGQRKFLSKTEKLKTAGVTILLTTYNRQICDQLADDAVIIEGGRIIAYGRYDEIMSSENAIIQSSLQELT